MRTQFFKEDVLNFYMKWEQRLETADKEVLKERVKIVREIINKVCSSAMVFVHNHAYTSWHDFNNLTLRFSC